MSVRKRYAIVGLGSRSRMFSMALLQDYQEHGQLVAFCDRNQTRMNYFNQHFADRLGATPVPTYKSEDFDRMSVHPPKPRSIVGTVVGKRHSLVVVLGILHHAQPNLLEVAQARSASCLLMCAPKHRE